jgi:ABC-type multidrug transport system fused ATPase/permease subunit
MGTYGSRSRANRPDSILGNVSVRRLLRAIVAHSSCSALAALAGGVDDLPLPDAAHHHRRVARHRVRPAQRRSSRTSSGSTLPTSSGHRTGDLMSRATNDLNAVRMMIGPAIMYTASTGLTFVVALVADAVDRSLADGARADAAAARLVSVRYFGAAIHRRFERIQAQLSEISALTQESLAGVRVVRAYRQEPFEIERFRDANEEYVRRNRGPDRPAGSLLSRAWAF